MSGDWLFGRPDALLVEEEVPSIAMPVAPPPDLDDVSEAAVVLEAAAADDAIEEGPLRLFVGTAAQCTRPEGAAVHDVSRAHGRGPPGEAADGPGRASARPVAFRFDGSPIRPRERDGGLGLFDEGIAAAFSTPSPRVATRPPTDPPPFASRDRDALREAEPRLTPEAVNALGNAFTPFGTGGRAGAAAGSGAGASAPRPRAVPLRRLGAPRGAALQPVVAAPVAASRPAPAIAGAAPSLDAAPPAPDAPGASRIELFDDDTFFGAASYGTTQEAWPSEAASDAVADVPEDRPVRARHPTPARLAAAVAAAFLVAAGFGAIVAWAYRRASAPRAPVAVEVVPAVGGTHDALTVESGRLQVRSDRPGVVYVDGVRVGDSVTLGLIELPAGTHTVVVESASGRGVNTARVVAGRAGAVEVHVQ